MGKVLIQGDWLDGFSSGKKAALLDWQHRREKREFDKLIAKLRDAKWTREHREQKNATNARWQATPRGRATRKAARERRRLARYRANPTIESCKRCGAVWCKAPWIRGVTPEFCGQACRKSWDWHHNAERRAAVQASRKARAARKAAA